MSYYIYKNNEQSGPFDDSAIENNLRNGSLLPNDLARIEASGEWSPLAAFFPSEAQLQGVQQPARHEIPKCLSCGAVTPWQIEPVLLPRHWIVFTFLLCAAGAGLIYLPMVWAIRMNSNSRAKICPVCEARNMWTFQY